ncbi:hypothetical protein [Spirosoma daeguense]
MRLFIYLFSLWLLLLTGLPCPDADCHIHENSATTESTSPPAEHDHEQGHKAPCSPFCHCATCLGFSTPQPFNYLLPADSSESAPERQIFTYRSPNQFDVMLGIWQPPQLRA